MMTTLNWQDTPLEVQRIVYRSDIPTYYRDQLQFIAADLSLLEAHEESDPQPGDFWIGCHPVVGWGDADPQRIGWASMIEVPLAVHALLSRTSECSTALTSPDVDDPVASPSIFAFA
jgi:hypothetical protein